jgi:thioredoxin 1
MNEQQIIQLINSGEKVLLDFYTKSCSVCKILDSQIALINDQTKTPIIKVDAEEMPELGLTFGIMKVPQLILVNEGKEVKRHMSFLPGQAILEFIGDDRE